MKSILYLLPFILFACGSTETTELTTEAEATTEIAKADIKADSEIVMEISGMTCEMGCVSTIRNHVNQMKGTTNFDMDFDTEPSTDFATIQFDSRVVSQEEIKEEIESIAQGIYSVVNVKSLPLVETAE